MFNIISDTYILKNILQYEKKINHETGQEIV